jgi:hypothetical protein
MYGKENDYGELVQKNAVAAATIPMMREAKAFAEEAELPSVDNVLPLAREAVDWYRKHAKGVLTVSSSRSDSPSW